MVCRRLLRHMLSFQEALHNALDDDPSSLLVFRCLKNIGALLQGKRDLDGAIPQRALAIQEVKTPNSLALAATYDTIGKLLRNKGDIGGALEQHRRALAIRELIG